MQFYDSIPKPLMTGSELLGNVMYDEIRYRVDDIFLTETAVPYKPRQVVTKIGQKRKINLVMTGTILNNLKIKERVINSAVSDSHKQYNLRGETVNFTFFDIRINRNPDAELYIDNNSTFYHYFRIMCVNKGLMDIDDFRNISLPYDELKDICRGTTETLAQYRVMGGLEWRFKYKGDNNGE